MLTNTPAGYILLVDLYPVGVLREREIIMAGKKDRCNEVKNLDESVTECPCCSGKHKDRDEKEFKDLMNRLKRIEGQVRGVEGMLENGAYCTDILIQVSAINSALNSFNRVLLGNHMRTCVADNIREGNDDVIDELMTILQKVMK